MTDKPTATFSKAKARALSDQCQRLAPGERRDWERLAILLNEYDSTQPEFAEAERVQLDAKLWGSLDAFKRFVVLTVHHKSGRLKGGSRRFKLGDETLSVPTSSGGSYWTRRDEVIAILAEHGYRFAAGKLVRSDGVAVIFQPPPKAEPTKPAKTKAKSKAQLAAAKADETAAVAGS